MNVLDVIERTCEEVGSCSAKHVSFTSNLFTRLLLLGQGRKKILTREKEKIRQGNLMEYNEQADEGGASSTTLISRFLHGSEKVGDKRRFRECVLDPKK